MKNKFKHQDSFKNASVFLILKDNSPTKKLTMRVSALFLLFVFTNFHLFSGNPLKSTVLTTDSGTIGAVNFEDVIAFKRVDVNSDKNFCTTVIEEYVDEMKSIDKVKIRIRKFKCSAKSFAEEAEGKGVIFERLHDGTYYNRELFYKHAKGFLTHRAIYITQGSKADVNKLKRTAVLELNGKRGGMIILPEDFKVNVPKHSVSKYRGTFTERGFAKEMVKGAGAAILVGTVILEVDASSQYDNAEMEFYNKQRKEIYELIDKYNSILYLQGECLTSQFALEHLIEDLQGRGECNLKHTVKNERLNKNVINEGCKEGEFPPLHPVRRKMMNERVYTSYSKISEAVDSLEDDFYYHVYPSESEMPYHPHIDSLSDYQLAILARYIEVSEMTFEQAVEDGWISFEEYSYGGKLLIVGGFALLLLYCIFLETKEPTLFCKKR